MFFLITEGELKRLVNGILDYKEKNPITKELTKSEKIALITWSGEDVALYLERKGIKTDKEGLEYIIQTIIKSMENCECAMCFESAMDYAIDDAIANEKAKKK